MIMDGLLLLDGSVSAGGVFAGTSVSSGSTFTDSGTQQSANIIDVSQLASSAKGYGRDIGIGDDLELVVVVTTNFAGTGATMQVQLQYAPDGGSGSPGSFVTVAESIAYAVGVLLAGTELMRIKLPPMTPSPATGSAMMKYIAMNYNVGTANMTAGAIAAFIVIDRTALGPGLGYQSGYSNQYL
ncbi:MAG: Bbp16 family capsid cement protein [Syntrophobacteraceae bacterium]